MIYINQLLECLLELLTIIAFIYQATNTFLKHKFGRRDCLCIFSKLKRGKIINTT